MGKATAGGQMPAKEADYKPDDKKTKIAAEEKKVDVEAELEDEKKVKAAGKHVIETEDEDEEIYFCKQHKREEYEGTHEEVKEKRKK